MVAKAHNHAFIQLPGDCRDWSHAWDKQQPPLKGQPAFCTMLIGVARKARWQPRTADSVPPVAFRLGIGLISWTRSSEAAASDVAQFNATQIRMMRKRGVRLWACIGWGVTGYPETIRIIEREVKGGEA